jgi:hypothetical protein
LHVIWKPALLAGFAVMLAGSAANSAGPEATHPARPGMPRHRVIPDGKGGLIIVVVDRPWNGTPGAAERARAQALRIDPMAPP